MKNFTQKDILIAFGLVLFGLMLGWVIFGTSDQQSQQVEKRDTTRTMSDQQTTWTCSMHPQIKQQEPGQCPICGMDLIPISEANKSEQIPKEALTMTEHAIHLADIQTTTIQRQIPQKEVYMPGKVAVDERRLSTITARFGGRIEELNINFTGQKVQKGEVLGSIYSSDLITAQKEFLEALKYKDSNPSLYRSARNKLKLWDLTDSQVNKIETQKEVQNVVPIVSPHAGVVTQRKIEVGEYVKEGTELFKVADLSRVWLLFDAYESDLPWIEEGDQVNFAVKALPGETFQARITFIDPFINPKTRTAKVRAEANNQSGLLKPGMLASGNIQAKLGQERELLVPQSSVLWTGKRSVVYVKLPNTEQPAFMFREVVLGPNTGEYYVVNEGLEEGQEVVTNGVFKVDAAAQLQGKPSMMGEATPTHQHGTPATHQEKKAGYKKTSFKVYGNCEMCKKRIEGALKDVKGVQQAIWHIESKNLDLIYDPKQVKLIDIHKQIAAVGHDTELEKADSSTYNELPTCCQYTRPGKKAKTQH